MEVLYTIYLCERGRRREFVEIGLSVLSEDRPVG